MSVMVGALSVADIDDLDLQVWRPLGTDAYAPARGSVDQPYGDQAPLTYFLHRILDIEPDRREPSEETEDGEPENSDPETQGSCNANDNSSFMDRTDFEGDNEPCFEQVVTGFVAGFRPKGIFAGNDIVSRPLPTGSTVEGQVYVASLEGGSVDLTGVLNATDRTVGEGGVTGVVVPSGDPAGCEALGEACYTRFDLSFTTQRPVAVGEQLTFQVNLVGAPDFGFGYQGEHISQFTVTPAGLPDGGLEFGVAPAPRPDVTPVESPVDVAGLAAFPDLGPDPQQAGFHPTTNLVEVSVDDPDFTRPFYVAVDPTTGEYRTELPLEPGTRTLYTRAIRDRFPSPTAVTETLEVAGVPGDGPGPGPGPGDPGPGPAPGTDLTVTRLNGLTRVDTAVRQSQEAFESADTVVLSRSDDWPDALAASTLAAEVDGPVLLTGPDEVAPKVTTELDRLGAETVYLTGGVDAVGQGGVGPRRAGRGDRADQRCRPAGDRRGDRPRGDRAGRAGAAGDRDPRRRLGGRAGGRQPGHHRARPAAAHPDR